MIQQIKRIFAMLDAPTRRGLVLVCVLMGVSTGLEMAGIGLLIPLFQVLLVPDSVEKLPVIGGLLASVMGHNAAAATGTLCITLMLFYAVKSLALGQIGWHQSLFVLERQATFAEYMLRTYLGRPYESLLGRNSAELVRNVTLLSMRLFVKGVLPVLQLATEVLAVLGVVAMLVLIDPLVTLGVGLVMAVAVGVFYAMLRRRLRVWGQITVAQEGEALMWLNQALGAPKVTKLARLEAFFCHRFGAPTMGKARTTALSLTAPTWPRLFLEAVAVIALLSVILVMVSMEGRPAAQVLPTLGILGVAAMRLLPSASKIIAAISLLRENSSTIDILHAEGFTRPEPASHGQPSAPPPVFRRELRLEGIGYAYPGSDQPVLSDISLSIPAGSSLALVGRSGAGKTTLADIILGVISPGQGHILVDGLDITADPSGWQNLIGYIPQDIYLLDDTLARNVALGVEEAEIDDAHLAEVLRTARLDHFVASLPEGVRTVVGERGARLSGGQRQRIGIARALYRRPSVLVMDEATSALDSETERDITDAIAALAGQKTVIIIAHRLSTIHHCDRVVLMEAGRIMDSGGFEELALRNADFARLVALSQLPG